VYHTLEPLLLGHLTGAADAGERAMTAATLYFAAAHADCLYRTCLAGHLTGSAFVVDADREHALLTHHAKLDRWLQPGGHADGEPDLLAVALREASEETGVGGIRPVTGAVFDVDRHWIPPRPGEPGHWHHDVRFLLQADRQAPLVVSHESRALAWAPLVSLGDYNADESLLRMARKVILSR
jgi:8-oxo-dGTP pyrophosphatase MutT (NUDIX family)